MAPKSDVWKHFSKTPNNLASCNICKKSVKTSGNTTNLISHMKSKHRAVYTKYFSNSTTTNLIPCTPGTTSTLTEGSEEMPSTSSASTGTSTQQPLESTGKNIL